MIQLYNTSGASEIAVVERKEIAPAVHAIRGFGRSNAGVFLWGDEMEKRLCKKCGSQLSRHCGGEFCGKHRDWTGKNNPFYGKTHSEKTRAVLRVKCKKASKLMWQDEAYRQKVIKGVSKPRREGFKKEQSIRITQWYKDNPEQRQIRSKAMKASWAEGRIMPNHFSCNKSKKESELFLRILEVCPDALDDYTIKCGGRKWYFPDIFIPDYNLIIEYYGDYWHANPKQYSGDEVVYHGAIAQEIWDRDAERVAQMKRMGYWVWEIWGCEYKEDPEYSTRILNQLDWDACIDWAV